MEPGKIGFPLHSLTFSLEKSLLAQGKILLNSLALFQLLLREGSVLLSLLITIRWHMGRGDEE